MTTRWPCTLLAMFCCLLALAASAHAECAWVLWLNHTGVVARAAYAVLPHSRCRSYWILSA
jgi:hypothetical protein